MTDDKDQKPSGTEGEEQKPSGEATEDNKQDLPPEVARALKKANKEAEQARLKLKEYEDAQKSEQEKLAEAKTAAEKDAASARQELVRYKVGAAKKLPPELIERLRGENEGEMEEDADRLLALLKPGSPNGSADQGARGAPAGDESMTDRIRKQLGRT